MIGLFPKNDAPIATPVIAFSDKGISIILFLLNIFSKFFVFPYTEEGSLTPSAEYYISIFFCTSINPSYSFRAWNNPLFSFIFLGIHVFTN